MRWLLSSICVFALFTSSAQRITETKIIILNAATNAAIEGATVVNTSTNETVSSNENGVVLSRKILSASDTLVISAIGFEEKKIVLNEVTVREHQVSLQPKAISLNEVKVYTAAGEQFRPLSKVDIKLRAINNSQEVLRMVPGLFIGQHAGGGKAEQIFLRGFDIDHGTDISISVDGLPVNMVSHAHGQGYADLHFLIPELIESVNFKKGTYYVEKGNFTTTGFVDFNTANILTNSSLKVEGGMFNTFRTVGMFNLLNERARAKNKSAYVASEYMFTNGHFDAPQNFNRINLFGKYYGAIGKDHMFNFSASVFSSDWNASGQIPNRVVQNGTIDFYGAVDPNEGGKTSRNNINATLVSTLNNGTWFKNQLYYSRYNFDLYSNFTFFKEDPVNGDQVRQKEKRNLYGYNGSFHNISYIGTTQLKTEIGVNVRLDRTRNSELSGTKNRMLTLRPLMLGNIAETNLAGYVNETFNFSSSFSVNAGLRFDKFQTQYTDKLSRNEGGAANAAILSPKLSLFYHASKNMQLYLSGGKGFHSNDTRVVVPQNGLNVLPAAYGADLGTVLKPAKNLLVNAALWYLWLDQEFVYVGDEGLVEPAGKSRRYGIEASVRYQPVNCLYADVDFNYSNARTVDASKGEDYLPLAPKFTSVGGLTLKTKKGVNASLRYRFMGNRPASEDNSVIAVGYLITDGVINYQQKKFEIGLAVQNLFGVKWKETQFNTESRLYNEPQPVSEIHFTPGTPLFLKCSVTYLF